jgi:hypothetical protein
MIKCEYCKGKIRFWDWFWNSYCDNRPDNICKRCYYDFLTGGHLVKYRRKEI